ncbi:hypothetical protein OCO53_03810 [Peribacillus frigoritolerans]|uniref:hypothetical protein n=1 Tax=Peribacillus frigoritolerans TaxID=450367 RepID=UPI0021CFB9A0|nr:hypothetical protein [Peribacillus frigoritolerans]MCU6599592.1 hypothetical protein [Peribacillus frigoritolerans]
MANIVSVGTSVPAPPVSGSLDREVTTAPISLALFGLVIPEGDNRVIINATVGVTSALLAPVLIFNIFRGNQVIFSSREEVLLSAGQEQTVSLHAIDTNVPATINEAYLLTVQLENELSAANVTGPVTFSGISYSYP